MSDGVLPLTPATVLSRGDIRDELTTTEGTVVLVADPPLHRVARLSPIGVAILQEVGDGCSLSALVRALTERLGQPPEGLGEPADLVVAAVREMLETTVLTADPEHKTDHWDDIRS